MFQKIYCIKSFTEPPKHAWEQLRHFKKKVFLKRDSKGSHSEVFFSRDKTLPSKASEISVQKTPLLFVSVVSCKHRVDIRESFLTFLYLNTVNFLLRAFFTFLSFTPLIFSNGCMIMFVFLLLTRRTWAVVVAFFYASTFVLICDILSKFFTSLAPYLKYWTYLIIMTNDNLPRMYQP